MAGRYVTHDGPGVNGTFADEEVDLNRGARIFPQRTLEEKTAEIEVLNVREVSAVVAIPECVDSIVRNGARRSPA